MFSFVLFNTFSVCSVEGATSPTAFHCTILYNEYIDEPLMYEQDFMVISLVKSGPKWRTD